MSHLRDLFDAPAVESPLDLAQEILSVVAHIDDDSTGDAVSAMVVALGAFLVAGRKPEMAMVQLEDEICGRLRLVMRKIHQTEEAKQPHG